MSFDDVEITGSRIEGRLVTRKLVIVSVGSSASIHLLSSIARRYPEILWENEIVLVETSRDMLEIAIEALTDIFSKYYVITKKSGEASEKGFPVTKFKGKLRENAILLADAGAASQPEVGMQYYTQKKVFTLEKIAKIYKESRASGIIVLGNAGKGTGTLVTPALISDLIRVKTLSIPQPLGFITVPFRFRKTDILNARKAIEFIIRDRIPIFLLDYEHALNTYIYLAQQSNEKLMMPTTSMIYQVVVDALATTLSTLIEALNYGQFCSPPMDWSDLLPLFKLHGRVGTVTFSFRPRMEDLTASWKKDLDNSLLLRTKTKPAKTTGLTIIKSSLGVPIDVAESIGDYFSLNWNAEEHEQFILERGEGYTIVSLLFGFDPRGLYPEIEPKKYSIVDRLRSLFGR